jgi:hypothetical protein
MASRLSSAKLRNPRIMGLSVDMQKFYDKALDT